MNLVRIAARIAAKKSYGDVVKELGDRLTGLENTINSSRREITAHLARVDQMGSVEWERIYAILTANFKYFVQQYWKVEELLRRIVNEPENEALRDVVV